MKIVKVIRDYLPHDKCDELNSWVRKAIVDGRIGKGITTDRHYTDGHRVESPLRYTSRMYGLRYQYPQLVRDLHAQIEMEFGLTKWHFPQHTHGRDGVVVSATMPGGDVYLHRDPTDNQEPKEVLRCNILTSETEGGKIIVAGESYFLKKGDMMQYLVSRHEHEVKPVQGEAGCLRIMWMFGWYVDGDEWELSINHRDGN